MSGALVILAFVVAVNPARLYGALPRADDRRSRVLVTVLGGAGSLAVYAALAAVAESLLDWLDVAPASMRIAAGLVLLVAGGRDLVGRPPAAEPALRGWQAAIVPVAIPLLLRPELAVLAIAAGADDGFVATVVAATLAVLLVVISAWAPAEPAPLPARVRDWLVRLTAVALIAVAAAIAVDGILAV